MLFIPAILTGKGVKDVEYLFMFLVSVSANIEGHGVCKWLDRLDKDSKPD